MNENCVVGHSDIVVRGFLSVIKDIITDRKGRHFNNGQLGLFYSCNLTTAKSGVLFSDRLTPIK